MTDTHTHLYSTSYGEDYEEAIKRSIESGVEKMILPGVDLKSIKSIRQSHQRFPYNTYMAMGLHPTDVEADWRDVVNVMEKELETGDYIAVGEIGIDLHWDKDSLPMQKEAFRHQLKIADRLKLPAILHSREAFDETLEIIEEVKPSVKIIFHSFTGTPDDVRKIRKICDPYFGINGVVTYKNAPYLRDALREIGIERILLETDAPYLTPVPHRGKKNDSSYLGYIRDKIAEVLEMSPADVESLTERNVHHALGI